MTLRRTWWIKLRRAEKHLAEFKSEFSRLRDGAHPLRVSQEIMPGNGMDFLIVRGCLPPLTNDCDDIAAIVGDMIANTRSALDHICVALTGSDRAQFPVFTDDIWQPDIDPAGKDRNKKRREDFKNWTRGMPAVALDLIKKVQPYAATQQWPASNPLAVLNRISNADKHRTLMIMSQYIYNERVFVSVPGYLDPSSAGINEPGRQRADGAILGTLPVTWPASITPLVAASGGIIIGLKEESSLSWDWDVPGSLDVLVEYIRTAVIDPLDAFAP